MLFQSLVPAKSFHEKAG